MPKYLRKKPLSERIKTYLNPLDFLLWLSEEFESNGWNQAEKSWAIPVAVVCNLTFIIAQANVNAKPRNDDDVFGDVRGPGVFVLLVNHLRAIIPYLISSQASVIVHSLTFLSFLNAVYTFWKRKHYRLFENPVDNIPSTPSAHRVRVDSSPVTSSPLRFLSTVLGTDSVQSRAHLDSTRDVWEIVVWDPSPISLRLFCLFSPGHIILYWLFFPIPPSDPRPSTTVATVLFLGLLLAIQLSLLTYKFSQQSKDTALISREVFHEYDTKYVRPRTQPLYRDVGTQFNERASYSELREDTYNTVDTYIPSVVINRGFRPNPNPNYLPHLDPDSSNIDQDIQRRTSISNFRTPATARDFTSPMKPMTAVRQPVFRPKAGLGDGGNLGVYSHAASPLKGGSRSVLSPRKMTNASEAARERSLFSPERRSRMSVPSESVSTAAATQKWGHLQPDRHRQESGRI